MTQRTIEIGSVKYTCFADIQSIPGMVYNLERIFSFPVENIGADLKPKLIDQQWAGNVGISQSENGRVYFVALNIEGLYFLENIPF